MHHNTKNLVGMRFGKWTVTDYAGSSYWHCTCDCGRERQVFTGNLSGNKSKSCGCERSRCTSENKTTHGLSNSPEYKTWAGIKRRCNNANDSSYSRYGSVGLTICERWNNSFIAFLEDMGKKPSENHTIDRIDNNSGYTPENCRWVTATEQNRNKRNNRIIEFMGERKTLSEWSSEFMIHHSLIQYRIKSGWTIDDALTKPPRKCNRSKN